MYTWIIVSVIGSVIAFPEATRISIMNMQGEGLHHRVLSSFDDTGNTGPIKVDIELEDGKVFSCGNVQPVFAICPVDKQVKVTTYRSGGKVSTKTHDYSCKSWLSVGQNIVCEFTAGVKGLNGCVTKANETCCFKDGVEDGPCISAEDDIEFEDCVLEKGETSEETCGPADRKLGGIPIVAKHRHDGNFHRNLQQLERWEGCHSNMDNINDFHIGIGIGSALRKKLGSVEAVLEYLEKVFAQSNIIYTRQLSVKLHLKHVMIAEDEDSTTWDNPGCTKSIYNQFDDWTAAPKIEKQGIWSIIDDCYKGYDAIGIGYIGQLCAQTWASSITYYSNSGRTWLTFAHEIGHNFGALHSFEEGKYVTGGIMDYGSKLLDGKYQFNKKHRYDDLCPKIENAITSSTCAPYWNLNNQPSVSCGDGYVSSDEECECESGKNECACCSNCKLKAQAVCSPFQNECCSQQCTFKEVTAMCQATDGPGYCNWGTCSVSKCNSYGLGEFCGVQSNPCRKQCKWGSVCNPLNGWTSGSVVINEIDDGPLCSTSSVASGQCKSGTCQPLEVIPSSPPTKDPTPLPTTKNPTPNPTKKPTPTPTTKNPTPKPTKKPTPTPTTKNPTPKPTKKPTPMPTTKNPTPNPTKKLTPTPTTNYPTPFPSIVPTPCPSKKSREQFGNFKKVVVNNLCGINDPSKPPYMIYRRIFRHEGIRYNLNISCMQDDYKPWERSSDFGDFNVAINKFTGRIVQKDSGNELKVKMTLHDSKTEKPAELSIGAYLSFFKSATRKSKPWKGQENSGEIYFTKDVVVTFEKEINFFAVSYRFCKK